MIDLTPFLRVLLIASSRSLGLRALPSVHGIAACSYDGLTSSDRGVDRPVGRCPTIASTRAEWEQLRTRGG